MIALKLYCTYFYLNMIDRFQKRIFREKKRNFSPMTYVMVTVFSACICFLSTHYELLMHVNLNTCDYIIFYEFFHEHK